MYLRIILRLSCRGYQEIRLYVFTYYFKVIMSLFSGNPTAQDCETFLYREAFLIF